MGEKDSFHSGTKQNPYNPRHNGGGFFVSAMKNVRMGVKQ